VKRREKGRGGNEVRLLWLWSPPPPPRVAAGAATAGGRTHEVGALAAALGSPPVRFS
jgi:hypothetical protein